VAEVDLRRLLHAVGAVPEVDGVQVGSQDLLLRPLLLEAPGERRLAQLAADRRRVGTERVLDELLRDRRPALHGAATEVVPGCAEDPAQVDAVVLVEALVLGCHHCVRDPRRDLLPGNDDPGLRAAEDRKHRVAVTRVDVRVRLRRPLRLRRVERAQLRVDRAHEPEHERREAERQKNEQEREQPQLANAPPLRRAGLSPEQPQGAR
jgi:hypothetical protein